MMNEGEIVKWQSSGYVHRKQFEGNSHIAYMGELVICRSAGMIEADGGPCPIISIYRPDGHLGALLHVDGGDAEIGGDNHEELIDQLLEIEPEITNGATCFVFYDAVPNPGEDAGANAEQAEIRGEFAGRIKAYLESKEIAITDLVLEGEGKSVHLDTSDGALAVTGYDEEVSFAYSHAGEAEQPKASGDAQPPTNAGAADRAED